MLLSVLLPLQLFLQLLSLYYCSTLPGHQSLPGLTTLPSLLIDVKEVNGNPVAITVIATSPNACIYVYMHACLYICMTMYKCLYACIYLCVLCIIYWSS
jgi:hypothetical protein